MSIFDKSSGTKGARGEDDMFVHLHAPEECPEGMDQRDRGVVASSQAHNTTATMIPSNVKARSVRVAASRARGRAGG